MVRVLVLAVLKRVRGVASADFDAERGVAAIRDALKGLARIDGTAAAGTDTLTARKLQAE